MKCGNNEIHHEGEWKAKRLILYRPILIEETILNVYVLDNKCDVS